MTRHLVPRHGSHGLPRTVMIVEASRVVVSDDDSLLAWRVDAAALMMMRVGDLIEDLGAGVARSQGELIRYGEGAGSALRAEPHMMPLLIAA